MTAWHDCTALQRDLLKAIADHDHYTREATADAIQIAVETRREAALNDTHVTDALAELETNELITTTSGTHALTDRGQDAIQQAARSLAIVTGRDLVVTDGGTTIHSHTAAASQGAPAKRRARADETADIGPTVVVDRRSGDSLLGIVRERCTSDECETSTQVLVESPERMVNVAAGRISIARGLNADVVCSLVEDETNV